MADASQLTLSFLRRHPAAAATVLEALDRDSAAEFLATVPVRISAPVVSVMQPQFAAHCLPLTSEAYQLALLPLLKNTAASAILRRLPATQSEALLQAMPAHRAFNLRLMLRYPVRAVGSWMDPNVPMLSSDARAGQLWSRLRLETTVIDRFLYVVDREQRLLGRVSTHELLRAAADQPVERLMHEQRVSVLGRDDIEQVLKDKAWAEHDPLPVLSQDGRFLGIARHAQLQAALRAGAGNTNDAIFTTALLELVDSYWSGLSRLIELPFPAPRSADKKE